MRSLLSIVSLLLASSLCMGFRVPSARFSSAKLINSKLNMVESDNKPSYEIVPLDKANIESAASFTGGLLGLILFGPIGAAVLAATVNYVSKKDNDAGEALRGLGKTVVESVNYFKKIDSKYTLTGKVVDTVTTTVSSVNTESESLDTVKKTFNTVVSKVKEINNEYDLVAKGKEVIGIAGTLSDAALEKVDELNKKYDFVETTKKAAATAVEKLKEQTASK